ncbi:MAG: DNA topoisomerase (ATP-hydrolyzing) subunit B [Nanoarchaeota archaeon]
MTKSKTGYEAESIRVLEGLEGVRQRPAMYIGSTGKEGLHHLVYEVIDNSVDEALGGYCQNIKVNIHKDGSASIEDDGRGIPTNLHPQLKIPASEVALTRLHAGGKFDKKSYQISGGLHGVGISCVNALSKKLILEIKRDGKIYTQEFTRGKTQTKLKIKGKCNPNETGTKIRFWPDEKIFSVLNFDSKILETRFREIAFLNAGLSIKLQDEIKEKKEEFHAKGGLMEFVKWLNKNRDSIHKPIYFKRKLENLILEVSIQYNSGYQENIFGFVNTINTVEGGTHISGFKTALTRSLNDYAKKTNLLKTGNLSGDDAREGVTAIVSVKLPNPQFEGQTKTKLGNSEIKGQVDSAVSLALDEFFSENPSVAKKIASKAMDSAKARLAAKKAKDLVRRKNSFSLGGLPGKLSDCSSKKSDTTELYIVEGESAGGCFSGDTKIALVDGRNLSFKNLVNEHKKGKQNYCYTINKKGEIEISDIKNPRITKRNAEVIKVILDNNQEIICTPDHQFMLRNGNYKKAKELTPSDSLMPLNKKLSKIGGKITIKAVENYNHKIKRIEVLNKKIDVYDLEVPETHNFALSSGIFVHNSAKNARDKEHQAILPLKGKILNIEKANQSRALSSDEITNMITAIGCGVGDDFNIEKIRYNKVIIMTDADVDGEHIKTLLLTFFFRFMPELIEEGHIYAAHPPLYRVRKKKDYYVYSDAELKKIQEKLKSDNVTRFKGLGEMSQEQLWNTTMNPKSRKLKKIYVEDAVEADQVFSMLMGNDVQGRKEFIAENAKEAELDV